MSVPGGGFLKRKPHPGPPTGRIAIVVVGVVCFVVGWMAGRGSLIASSDGWSASHASMAGLSKALGAIRLSSQRSDFGAARLMCENTCRKANDGVCDEGRGGEGRTAQHVYCDLGTDCADCGPHYGPPFSKTEWPDGGPVAYLRHGLDVELLTKRTVSRPSFLMMYTDPEKDVDVSGHMHAHGMIENGITEIFRQVLQGRCVDPVTGKRRLVLDVGANFGYFSVYAAKLGCRVIAWEPVPHFRAFTQWVLHANNVTHLVTVRDRVVSDEGGKNVTMQAPTKGIWGTASVAGIAQDVFQEPTPLWAVSERIDDVVDEDVLLMKVDVEGFEPLVLRSASRLLNSRAVDNVVFEYNPGVAERAVNIAPELTHLVTATPGMLIDLLDKGYKMGMMYDFVAKAGAPYVPGTFPALPEITRMNLEYDMQDAADFVAVIEAQRAGKPTPEVLSCPVLSDLVNVNPEWGNCIRQPENAHPKSLRGTFTFNTNIWASKEVPARMKLEGTVGVLPLTADARRQFYVGKQMTVGFRSCAHLPSTMLIINRCPCSWAEQRNLPVQEVSKCKAEAAVVEHVFSTGRLRIRDHQHPG